MATNMACPIPDCGYSTGDQTEPVAIAYLNAHMYAHMSPPAQQQSAASGVRRGGPKLDRPTIKTGVSMEEWIMFTRRWNIFREGSQIADDNVSHHLFQCADEALGDALLKTDPDILRRSIDVVLNTMKKLAVIPVATGLIRSELLEMKQLRDEAFRKFASRVRGKAETCEYETSVVCRCTEVVSVNFTDHIMRDVLLAGIYDADIRRKMYGIDRILEHPINDVVAAVEKKEMARDAHSAVSASSMSSMKLQKRKGQAGAASGQQQLQKAPEADKCKQASCPHCKQGFALYREGRFGWNSKPFDMCRDCFRTQRRKKPEKDSTSVSSVSEADVGIIVAHLSSIGEAEVGPRDGPSDEAGPEMAFVMKQAPVMAFVMKQAPEMAFVMKQAPVMAFVMKRFNGMALVAVVTKANARAHKCLHCRMCAWITTYSRRVSGGERNSWTTLHGLRTYP